MSRIGRTLAILAFGWFVALAPLAVAPADAAAADNAEIVRAQTAPPGPDLNQPGSDEPQRPADRQRVVIGVGGIVLIAAVLISRRIRKKPNMVFHWKRN